MSQPPIHCLEHIQHTQRDIAHLLRELVVDLPVHDEPLTTGTVLTAVQEGSLDSNGNNLGIKVWQKTDMASVLKSAGKWVILLAVAGCVA